METKQTRIVIIGAGYAGLLATVRLAGKLRNRVGKSPAEITLVSASDTYLERLRLHQLATNRPVKSRSIAQVLSGTRVKFVQGRVTGLGLSGRIVSVQTAAILRAGKGGQIVVALFVEVEHGYIKTIRAVANPDKLQYLH
jgi:NADH dehydrogenase FAD-containing subunit